LLPSILFDILHLLIPTGGIANFHSKFYHTLAILATSYDKGSFVK